MSSLFNAARACLDAATPDDKPALTLAMLGAIESLLCARVADGMIGDRHDPNQELMAQGIANFVTPFFGGMPATGTIARTVTNIRAGASSPVAGIVHALSLALVVLLAAPLAQAQDAGFQRCLAALQPQAAARGIDAAQFTRLTADLQPDRSVLPLLNAQPEFTTPIWDYLSGLVDEQRVADGRAMLATHGELHHLVGLGRIASDHRRHALAVEQFRRHAAAVEDDARRVGAVGGVDFRERSG